MCLIRHEFNDVKITKPSYFSVTCNCLILHLRSLASAIIIPYCPPSSTVAETINLIAALKETLALGYRPAIIGNMNFSDINWLDDPPLALIDGSKAFVGMCAAWNLSQIVQGPTRGSSWLDLVPATDTSAFTNNRIDSPISSSDHCLVVCDVILPQCIRANYATQRIIDNAALQQQLNAIHWPIEFAATVNVNRLWDIFQTLLVNAIDSCSYDALPRSLRTSRRLRALFLRKRRRWKLRRSKPTAKYETPFDVASKQLSQAIQQNRKRAEENLLKASTAKFFHYA